jgi:hypothetical protein
MCESSYNIKVTNQGVKMKYRKLFKWIDGDDACEATAVTIYSAHDPAHDGEQDFIIRRVASLIETGVTIQSITLTVWPSNDAECQDDHQVELINDHVHIDVFTDVIKNIYSTGQSIETMIIKVDIREDRHSRRNI